MCFKSIFCNKFVLFWTTNLLKYFISVVFSCFSARTRNVPLKTHKNAQKCSKTHKNAQKCSKRSRQKMTKIDWQNAHLNCIPCFCLSLREIVKIWIFLKLHFFLLIYFKILMISFSCFHFKKFNNVPNLSFEYFKNVETFIIPKNHS
jgi:hypothetical protein